MKKNSINLLIFGFINLLFLLNAGLLFSADIEIDDNSGAAGDQRTFTVSINNAPKDIKGLQFNVKFDSNVMSFEKKEDGALASSFDQFNVAVDPNNNSTLIVAGISFGSGLSAGTTGDLVLLNFKVNICQETTLELVDLKGDTLGLSTKNGQFVCSTGGGPTPTPPPTSSDGAAQLTFNSGNDLGPSWSPAGDTIAFSSNRGNFSSNTFDIWAIEPDGNNVRQLADGPEDGFGISAFLKWIGTTGDLVTNERTFFHEYMRFNLSTISTTPVFRTSLDGTDSFFTRILSIPGGLGGDGMDVSKDGTQLAWQIRTTQNNVTPVNGEIRVGSLSTIVGQAATTAGTKLIENINGLFGGFSFSPNGSQLVISLNGNLAIYNLNGTVARQLTLTGSDSNPVWTRQDGIFYDSTVAGNTDIFMIKPDGSELTRITTDPASDVQPTVSPDGTKLAFTSGRSGNNDIWVIDAPDAGPVVIITPIPTPGATPVPDGFPVAEFRTDFLFGLAPLDVQFTDLSSNNPTTWTWDFGDGSTSSLQNPLHTYLSEGSYTVKLTVANSVGVASIEKKDLIEVFTDIIILTPIPSFTPFPGKRFTFECQEGLVTGSRGLERLVLEFNEEEHCTLKITNFEPGVPIEVSTLHRSAFHPCINVDPQNGFTDLNGELEFTITAVGDGLDWIAWAVKNDKDEFEFSKKAYDNGSAWGMFVNVK